MENRTSGSSHGAPGLRADSDSAGHLVAAHGQLTSPADRLGKRAITVFFALLAVALVGLGFWPLDVVVRATGESLADDPPIIFTAPFSGSVEEVFAEPRMNVRSGTQLVRLKPSTGTRLETVETTLVAIQGRKEEILRLLALVDTLASHRVVDTSLGRGAEALAILGQYSSLRERLRSSRANAIFAEEAASLAARRIQMARDRLERIRGLAERGYASNNTLLEIEENQNLAMIDQLNATARLDQVSSDASYASEQIGVYLSETRSKYEQELREIENRLAELRNSLDIATQSQGQSIIVAPVDGYLETREPIFVGRTVALGDPLYQLTPNRTTYTINTLVKNADIGSVRLGQPARVRFQSIRSSRYSPLTGRVKRISNVPVQPPSAMQMLAPEARRPPEFMIEIEIRGEAALAHGLRNGMSARVEIITGERRPIYFLAEPLLTRTAAPFSEQ